MTPTKSPLTQIVPNSAGGGETSDVVSAQCPLCKEAALALYHTATRSIPWRLYAPHCAGRTELRFFRCAVCDLIVKDPEVRSTREQEREHYAKHNNDIRDTGYRAHLVRLLEPVLERASSDGVGLDFGCGPSLSIEVLARERGVECLSYDPHFFPGTEKLRERSYDFITCSEVVEHFSDPLAEFSRLVSLLKPGGILGVMTHLVPQDFSEWWYHRDPTHVVFYSERTFQWLSSNIGCPLLYSVDGVVLFEILGSTVISRSAS